MKGRRAVNLESQLKQIVGGLQERVLLVTRRASLEIAQRVIERSPVDTGRFRGNWVCAMHAPAGITRPTTDKDGGETLGAVSAALSGWQAGQTIYITNHLPYAYRLEHGWSQQAPHGMVRLTVAEFVQHVKSVVETLK